MQNLSKFSRIPKLITEVLALGLSEQLIWAGKALTLQKQGSE